MYPKEKKIPVDIDLESPEMRMVLDKMALTNDFFFQKRKTVCHCIQVMNGIFQTGLVIKTNVYVFELVEALVTIFDFLNKKNSFRLPTVYTCVMPKQEDGFTVWLQ